MIEINIGLLVFLIASNFFTVIVAFIVIYIVAGLLDLTYHKRHRDMSNKNKNTCPYEIEDKDDEIRR